MNIPEELKTRLLSELSYVIQKIETETDPKRRTYFLSAAHGAIERTMRFHSDGELYIIHFTLNLCYSTVSSLLGRIASGDTAVLPPGDMWERITQYLGELRDVIEKGASTYPILEKITVLTYSMTGSGYYTSSYLMSLESPNS